MAKEFSLVIKVCETIFKYSIYALIALVPIFFLPLTTDILDFNKQALLTLLVFISLFAIMIKVLISGKFSANLNKTHIAIVAMMLVYLASTIFSKNSYGSFWGWPQISSESLLTIIGFVLFYFIVANMFSKKEIIVSMIIFGVSCIVAILFASLQLLGLFVIPLNILKDTSFNTIGSVGSFGMLLAILLPLFTVFEIVVAEKWLKIVFGVGIALSAVCLVLVNYPLVWWAILASSAILIFFGASKRNLFDLRWLAIPIFFFVLALFFITLKPSLILPQRPVEVYLNQQSSFDVALQTIKAKPILGSGPGTFVFDFAKYKNKDFNQSSLWNLKINSAASKILTTTATTGILGIIALFALIIIVIFYGTKLLLQDFSLFTKTQAKIDSKQILAFKIMSTGLFASFLATIVVFFLYNSGFVLDFAFFFLIACFVGMISEKKEYNLSPSSFLTLGITLIFTLIFIFGLGLTILESQRYYSELSYYQGILAIASGNKDVGIGRIENAVSQNPNSDLYLTDLSQAYLSEIISLASKKDITEEEKTKFQILVNNSINTAKLATDINPNSVSNWSIRGYIYQSLVGIVSDAEDWAIKCYEEASKLEPINPYFVTQKGIVYLIKSYGTDKDNAEAKAKNLDMAKEQFDKAIELKSDYASARFQLAMVLQAQEKTDQVMPALQETKKYAPYDVGLSFQIGLLYYQKGDYKNAEAELERTIALNPKYANGLYFLGLTYSKLGENTKAILAIKKVLELNPENEEVKKILENLNVGKDPLDGISQETIAQSPIEEADLVDNKGQ